MPSPTFPQSVKGWLRSHVRSIQKTGGLQVRKVEVFGRETVRGVSTVGLVGVVREVKLTGKGA